MICFRSFVLSAVAVLGVCGLAFGQEPASSQRSPNEQAPPAAQAPAAGWQATPAGPATQDLKIGPGDEGDMTVYGIPEMTQHVRVNTEGEISIPLIGKVLIAGMTAAEAEAAIEKRFSETGTLNNPHVNLYFKESNSQSVTVLGEVAHPGSYSLTHARRLYDAFMVAGGLTVRAGNTVAITHSGEKTSQVLPLASDPVASSQNNVELRPGDTIAVSRAGVIYVVGEVIRPGGFVIDTDKEPTVSQLLAMAAGPSRVANLSHARVLRRTADGLKNEEVDLKKVLAAKAQDLPLRADDILFVPASKGKLAVDRGSSSVLNMITGLALYRF
ncbi:MAG: polysaccharide biosynthesis/export family protein [Terriglobales bacterium]